MTYPLPSSTRLIADLATSGALPQVNGTLSQSKLIAAIADSTGSSVELAAPAADLVANRAALLIPGAVTFAGYV